MKLAALLLLPLMVMGAPEGTPADDLTRVQSEPHPDKRAHMALDNAEDALKHARDAYDKGDNEAMAARLQEVERSVELSES